MIKKFIKYTKSQEFVRMLLIALLGVLLGFITYEIIYYFNPFSPRASLSWILAFIIGTARQHALHRHFTFLFKTNYWKSLYRAYVLDFGVLILSSLLNWFLTEILNVHHIIAWGFCLLLTALIDLLLLKYYVFEDKTTLKT